MAMQTIRANLFELLAALSPQQRDTVRALLQSPHPEEVLAQAVEAARASEDEESGWRALAALASAPPRGQTLPPIAPHIQEALDAFRRDLPELLQKKPGAWVAYAGARQLGFGKTQTELYQRCFAQGLQRGKFIVRCIEPEIEEYQG
jgi:hypothetical protein